VRYGSSPSNDILARVEHELAVIGKQGFTSYFLIVSAAAQRPVQPARPKRIIGKANNVTNTNTLKSAKPYVKKAIYGLYNISSDETVESVSSFVSEIIGVNPISCFLVNNKNAVNESNTNESIAFRVCIDAQYNAKFSDPLAWYNGIVVKPWKFKAKPRESQVNTLPPPA
jgi:hypothetical protein